ncbi:MAG: YIP1 family protein [Deltaproteobacteria bacterium]|nr:YIP1 family protein [Deltaproteobacteria bacterium]
MAIVERVKSICLKPNLEWTVIAAEPASTGSLITGYVLPLAAVGAVAGLIGRSLIGVTVPYIGSYRVPIVTGIVSAVFALVMAVVAVLVLSVVINALAPSFGGEKNSIQALKVAVYSYTPAWVAGVLQILPALSVLMILAGLYGLYLLYMGLPRLMKCPQDKAIGYTAVVVICAIVITFVISAVGGVIAGAGAMGVGAGAGALGLGAMTGAGSVASPSDVQFDKDSALGKLEALGKNLEVNNKKMAAAQKSGDPNAQVAAAMASLGTILGGGKRVDPLGIDQLKGFVPDTFGGLPKKSSNASKSGVAGLTVSKAEATYSDGGNKRVTLEISDSGGASGLLGMAGWVGLQGEREDDNSSERTQKVDGRLVHEKVSKNGGTNKFEVVLGDRFIVSTKGHGLGIEELKTAVASLDLNKLESLKGVGVGVAN